MRHFAVVTSIVSFALLTGCSSSRHDPTEKYFLVASNIKLPYWQTAGNGIAKAAKDLGVQGQIVGPDTYDPQGEASLFREVIAKKPSGILVSAADPNVMQAPIDEAISQGIPVIAIDADSPKSKRLLFIGTNNYEAGRMGARKAAELLGRKGSVVVYTIERQENLTERLHGYRDVFGDNIKILQVIDMKGDPRVAFDTTNDMVTQGKMKPDGFICLEAIACKEVAEVLSRNKVTGRVVVAMDTDEDTLHGISNGRIQATVAQKPFTMAFYGLKMLDDLHHDKPANLSANWDTDTMAPIPKFVDTGASLIDKSNVDAFLQARKAAGQEQ
jgi:ribose transport system substrate-binding protein